MTLSSASHSKRSILSKRNGTHVESTIRIGIGVGCLDIAILIHILSHVESPAELGKCDEDRIGSKMLARTNTAAPSERWRNFLRIRERFSICISRIIEEASGFKSMRIRIIYRRMIYCPQVAEYRCSLRDKISLVVVICDIAMSLR
jgi:hypothetical protein